jgi:hypothetical protein
VASCAGTAKTKFSTYSYALVFRVQFFLPKYIFFRVQHSTSTRLELYLAGPLVLMFDAFLNQLEMDLRTALGTCVTKLVATARTQLESAHADVAKERVQGLAEVAEERAKALAEVVARRAELGREVAAMHMHKEAQEGRIVLNVGGYRFETSVQTLRRVPHTFFDAYFSGRYAQDVCNDGSIFVDRDGEHFGHVLEYMRDGVVSLAEADACPSVSLLRVLKREFGFYCIELSTDEPAALEPEMVFVLGGFDAFENALFSMDRYDVSSDQWSSVADMGTARYAFGACAVAGNVYVTGGLTQDDLSSVEMYSPLNDVWSIVASMPEPRSQHASVSVGAFMYVLGGIVSADDRSTSYITASVLRFDSAQGIWSVVAPLPEPRHNSTACVVGSDIYVFGGVDDTCGGTSTVFKYDTEADNWSTLAPMPAPAMDYGYSAIELGGLIYIVGGGINSDGLLSFNPTSEIWIKLCPLNSECCCGVSFVLRGCLYAAAAKDGESIMQRYDVTTNAWMDVGFMPEERYHFGAVTIGTASPAEERDLFDVLIAKMSK